MCVAYLIYQFLIPGTFEILIDSIKQHAPRINCVNVFENLDHEGFYIPNEAAFSFFMSTFRQACQDSFYFVLFVALFGRTPRARYLFSSILSRYFLKYLALHILGGSLHMLIS